MHNLLQMVSCEVTVTTCQNAHTPLHGVSSWVHTETLRLPGTLRFVGFADIHCARAFREDMSHDSGLALQCCAVTQEPR